MYLWAKKERVAVGSCATFTNTKTISRNHVILTKHRFATVLTTRDKQPAARPFKRRFKGDKGIYRHGAKEAM